MSLSSDVYDHLTGAYREMGFYVFRCKCKHQWAMPAGDPRLWLDGDVANVRWVDPRMTCPKCGKSVTSNDDLWCPDPADEKDRRMKAFVERTQPQLVAGVFPVKSWAVCPEGITELHVRVRKYMAGTEEHPCEMTCYSLFDAQDREYVNSKMVPGTITREDGAICWWMPSAEMSSRLSVDYTEAVEYFRSDRGEKSSWTRVEG